MEYEGSIQNQTGSLIVSQYTQVNLEIDFKHERVDMTFFAEYYLFSLYFLIHALLGFKEMPHLGIQHIIECRVSSRLMPLSSKTINEISVGTRTSDNGD